MIGSMRIRKVFSEYCRLSVLDLAAVCLVMEWGNIISRQALKGSPEIARQIEIEQKDERNIAIGNQAKAKGFDMMTFAFGALMICFALMEIELAVRFF